MEHIDKIENYESYWDLTNAIEDLCCKAMDKGNLWEDDVISALDRVKAHWIVEHAKNNFEYEKRKAEENESDNESSD